MKKAAASFISLFVKVTLVFLVLAFSGSLFLDAMKLYAISLGYLLSLLFVGSNVLVIRRVDLEDHMRFYKTFFVSTALRFILVIASVILVLAATKIHQIYFTVSFIISYIFHSVIEIIFINKILKTDN